MAEAGQDRWVEVSPSQFPHEAEGLAVVRAIMPDETPYRAWSNFEFRDSRGRWHEVDLLLLGRRQLHLVELKYYSGILRGDDQRWARDGRRPEDSPLKLARRKAQFFGSKLKDELRLWAHEQKVQIPDERDVIPFVQKAVFLHHSDLRCALAPSSAINLYGLDGHSSQSQLAGISDLVLESAGRRAIGPNQEHILVKLLERIGLVQRREREAGSWVIEDQAIDSDEGWQDWLAYHRVVQQDRARVQRFDDCQIRLRENLTRAEWQALVADADQRLCLPEVNKKALDGLKFSEALPERLALATLASRLADLGGATTVLQEPTRFVQV